MNTKKLAIYARQSRLKDTDGSIEDQILKGKEKAKDLEKEYTIYIDRGISAADNDINRRPGFSNMLNDIEQGFIDSVFVIDCSRLTRNTVVEAIMKEVFRRNNVLIYSTIEGIIDYKDSTGEFMSGLFALLNRKHIVDTTSKIKSVLRNRAAEGKAHGGILKPYGYVADENKYLVIEHEEAKVVRQIFSYSEQGIGTGKIANLLNKEGIRTKGRKVLKNGIWVKQKHTQNKRHIPQENLVWKGNTILSMLRNPLYKGSRIYKDETFSCPAIIEEAQWDRVQKSLSANRNKQGTIKHQYLLKGICRCGKCGSNIVGRTRVNKRDHYYYCASKLTNTKCGLRSLNIDYLEEIVWYTIANSSQITDRALEEVKKFKNPEYLEELRFELKNHNGHLAVLLKVKPRIVEMFTMGQIEREEMKVLMDQNKAELEVVNNRIKDLEERVHGYNSFLEGIDNIQLFQLKLSEIQNSSSYEMKKYLVNLFLQNVIIDFDEEIETYTIKMNVKLPELNFSGYEEHHFYLKKGEVPNLLQYDSKFDNYEKSLSIDSSILYKPAIKNGKLSFRNYLPQGTKSNIKLLPHSATRLHR